jgi:type I restriction enzyme S subunit
LSGRKAISRYSLVKFGNVVRNANLTEKDPLGAGIERIVGLEHLDSENLHIRRWNSIEDSTSFIRKFVPGQTLFGKRRAYQRKVAYAEFEGICSGDILTFESKNSKVLLPELLPFICQSDTFFDYALGTSAGSLSPRTSWTALKDFEFSLPPIDEQERIAEILWAADEAREKWDFAISELLECKKVYAAKSLSSSEGKELSINDFGQPGEQVLKTGPFGSHLKTDYFQNAGVPIINISALGENGMDESGFFYMSEKYAKKFESYMVREGDLVFSRVADIGRCLVIDEAYSNAIISSNLIRIRVDKNKIRPMYLYLLLKVAPNIRKQIMAITATGGRLLVNTKTMQRLIFEVPPIKVQDAILEQINKFSSSENLCSQHRVELEILQKILLSRIAANPSLGAADV